MTTFTKDQLAIVRAFLAQVRERAKIEREEWWESYQSWWRGDRVWRAVYGFAGTDVHTALWWFQHRHKPGSKTWQPVVIIRALVAASERDYVEPERMPTNELALEATPAERTEARKTFIRTHGVEAFYRHVNPILSKRRVGGVQGLFTHPATNETRAFVKILATIAGGRNNNNGGLNGHNGTHSNAV